MKRNHLYEEVHVLYKARSNYELSKSLFQDKTRIMYVASKMRHERLFCTIYTSNSHPI